MAKLFCSETAFRVADRAVQVLGGEGIVQGSRVEFLFRVLRMYRVLTGTSAEIQTVQILRKGIRLDGIYVGPADLGLSLGGEARGDQTDPKIVDAIQTIVKACKKHKIYAGIHCGSTDYAKKAIGWGFQFTTILADNALLVNAAKATVAAMREGNATGARSSGGSMY